MSYLARRLAFYLLAAWASVTLAFAVPRLMPGDPLEAMLARFQGKLRPEALPALREALGLTGGSLPDQYLSYLRHLARGELGISLSQFPASVGSVIGTGLLWTLFLCGLAVVLSFALGTALGVVAAWRRGRWLDRMLPPALILVGSLPYFWLAMLALFLFGVTLEWFPVRHAYDADLAAATSWEFVGSVLAHAVLPAATIVVATVGGWMLGMRNTMLRTLAEDHVLLARAKGLPERRIMVHYAARNALLPNVTAFGMELGFVLSGALLTEIVFSYPGQGYLLLRAVQSLDYPLIQGLFLTITAAVLGANWLVDVAHVWLDPEDAAAMIGRRRTKTVVGAALLALFAALALLGPVLAPDAGEPVGIPLSPPSLEHPLGTTAQGQDVLAQTVAGARPSLAIGFAVGLMVVVLGALVGTTAGYFGGWVDDLLSLVINVFLVMPGLPLMVVIAAYLPPTPGTIGLALVITGWSWSARVFRSQTLSLRASDFVAAAVVGGESPARIIVAEILPNMLSPMVSAFIGATIYAIGAQVGLEFLGLGDLGRVTWGTNLYWARNDAALLTGSWWTFVPTGTCVGLVGFALAMLNDALDQVGDPRLRTTRPADAR